jgi:hypothetical protein
MSAKSIVVLVAAVLFAAAGIATAAPDGGLNAVFTVQFPKGHQASNAPCPSDVFCGVGHVTGFGPATVSILDETFDEILDSPCLAITRVESVDLLDGSGSLVLESAGTFCRPGGSGESSAGSSSYGSPGRFELSYAVDGSASTGIFAGAAGSGAETMSVDGGIGVWRLAGALRLD